MKCRYLHILLYSLLIVFSAPGCREDNNVEPKTNLHPLLDYDPTAHSDSSLPATSEEFTSDYCPVGEFELVLKDIKRPVRQFDISIEFFNPYGTTITDSTGIWYYFDGNQIHDPDIIYIPMYWGEYSLYHPETPVFTKLDITFIGPHRSAYITVKTICFVINTDGTNGILLDDLKTYFMDLDLLETRMIDATFTLPSNAKDWAGLCRFIVEIYIQDRYITGKEGVFCPPRATE